MFKKDKDIDQRSSNVIKNKDFKKLKSDLLKQFSLSVLPSSSCRGITEESLAILFPPKCSITLTKFTSRTLVYSVDSVPLFFDVNGRCDFYPTIFALWKVPTLLPQVVIHSPVSTFVLRGADLMAPGLYKLDDAIQKGDKVSIRVRNNSFPFAVGASEVDAAVDFMETNTRPRGKAVQVWHMFSDMLWKNVPLSIPNKGFGVVTVVTGDDQGDDSCDDSDDDDDKNEDIVEDEEDERENDLKQTQVENDDSDSADMTASVEDNKPIDELPINLDELSLTVKDVEKEENIEETGDYFMSSNALCYINGNVIDTLCHGSESAELFFYHIL